MRITIESLLEKKKSSRKISMLTAYDYSFSSIVDKAGIDIILVGDSMANVILGMESTTEISLDEMINHTKAVVRGSSRALVVGDMPFCSYQHTGVSAVESAWRFIKEGGCQAVKLEWFDDIIPVTRKLVDSGIPVMGHIGFTPQTADKLGGSVVQGRDLETAKKLIKQAHMLQDAGCFSMVLECVPWQIARIISEKLTIFTIGIGAGKYCDGQVLVINDLLGLFKRFIPKFVRVYDDIFQSSVDAIVRYRNDVENGDFPSIKESFTMKEEDFEKLKGEL